MSCSSGSGNRNETSLPAPDPIGETGANALIKAAVAVSVPFLLGESAKRLDQGFSRVYQWGLMHSMRNAVAEKRRRMKLPLKIQDLSKLKTFRDFDEHITAPLHGFAGADDYYAPLQLAAIFERNSDTDADYPVA